jgi:hypothetical protein
VRGWLTPKPDPEFESKCAEVCALYQEAPAAAQQDVRTVSVDEMTGVQALERAAPDLPVQPGKVARRADSDEAGHAFQYEAGHLFRSEAGHRSDLKPAAGVRFRGSRRSCFGGGERSSGADFAGCSGAVRSGRAAVGKAGVARPP